MFKFLLQGLDEIFIGPIYHVHDKLIQNVKLQKSGILSRLKTKSKITQKYGGK